MARAAGNFLQYTCLFLIRFLKVLRLKCLKTSKKSYFLFSLYRFLNPLNRKKKSYSCFSPFWSKKNPKNPIFGKNKKILSKKNPILVIFKKLQIMLISPQICYFSPKFSLNFAGISQYTSNFDGFDVAICKIPEF